jgi:hypothetical protein
MHLPPDSGRQLDSVVLLLVFALFLLASPLREWWAADRSPWFMPYLLWALILGLVFVLARRRGHHDL